MESDEMAHLSSSVALYTGTWTPFNQETVRLMIGTLELNEPGQEI